MPRLRKQTGRHLETEPPQPVRRKTVEPYPRIIRAPTLETGRDRGKLK